MKSEHTLFPALRTIIPPKSRKKAEIPPKRKHLGLINGHSIDRTF
jgi:hypothetical protein